jgi:hypothetical protein
VKEFVISLTREIIAMDYSELSGRKPLTGVSVSVNR